MVRERWSKGARERVREWEKEWEKRCCVCTCEEERNKKTWRRRGWSSREKTREVYLNIYENKVYIYIYVYMHILNCTINFIFEILVKREKEKKRNTYGEERKSVVCEVRGCNVTRTWVLSCILDLYGGSSMVITFFQVIMWKSCKIREKQQKRTKDRADRWELWSVQGMDAREKLFTQCIIIRRKREC